MDDEQGDASTLVRTDFSDDSAWVSLVRAATAESPEGFQAELRLIDERQYDGRLPSELASSGLHRQGQPVLFVADREALTDREQPILCVDLLHQPGRSFRCIPAELWGVENNLRLFNMDFEEFAESADADGVFRGFE